MQRWEGCGVSDGLGRGRRDVVVDDRATRMQINNRDTVLGVVVECRPAIAITKWATALGRKQRDYLPVGHQGQYNR